MMDMLFGHVRVVPDDFLLESPRRGVMLDLADIGPNNPFEGLKYGTRTNTLYGISPPRAPAEVHGVVIPVREPESNRQASGRREPERIDQLLPQKAHRRRTENDDTLIVQADEPLVRPEIEQFCEVQVLAVRRVVAMRLPLHSSPILRSTSQRSIGSGGHWSAAVLLHVDAEEPADRFE